MPPGHWATREDLNFRYYSAEHGYWMYAQEWEQIQDENGVKYDGKRIRLKPFLAISTSQDDRKVQTIASDRAVVDLNQPLGFSSDAAPLKVLHMRWESNVEIVDNKGTPDPFDDMKVHLRTFEFDDATQQFTSDSHVVIEDFAMITSGDGMLVQLGKKDASAPAGSSGFDSVERMELLKNPHVIMHDVGKSGMMPGAAKSSGPGKLLVDANVDHSVGPNDLMRVTPGEPPTPLDLTCDYKMQVFPAKTHPPVLIGPPAPPNPTFVQFDRNVVVIRGRVDENPGQLTCDTLRLTMIPAEAPPPPRPPSPQTASTESTRATGSVPDKQPAPASLSSASPPLKEAQSPRLTVPPLPAPPSRSSLPRPSRAAHSEI